jgi:hypothetical protein
MADLREKYLCAPLLLPIMGRGRGWERGLGQGKNCRWTMGDRRWTMVADRSWSVIRVRGKRLKRRRAYLKTTIEITNQSIYSFTQSVPINAFTAIRLFSTANKMRPTPPLPHPDEKSGKRRFFIFPLPAYAGRGIRG